MRSETRSPPLRCPPTFARWSAKVLLSIFSAQETTETLLRTGSLDQLLSLVHHSGAAALLAAIAVGRLVKVALSGLDTLEANLANACPPRRRA